MAEEHFNGCLLDNGQVWAKDTKGAFFDASKFPHRNIDNWVHLSYFDEKTVVSVTVMDDLIYILCKDTTQKIYNYTSKNVQDIEIIEIPLQDYTNSFATTIIKMVSSNEFVLYLCEDGLYAFGDDYWEEHPINARSEQFRPCTFFEDKKVLDIGASLHFYILCDDGVYTIPSER